MCLVLSLDSMRVGWVFPWVEDASDALACTRKKDQDKDLDDNL